MSIKSVISARGMNFLAATILSTWGASAAFAQDAAPATSPAQAAAAPAEATAEPVGNPADIVVTARKSKERLQDVPVTITALSSQLIEKTDTRNIFDLATRTPGLYYGTSGGRNGGNKLQIRNLSTGTAGGSKASVFIDGVFVSGDYASTPFANLDRVEVLKGPQSVYFGRSTFVGAVNFVTRDPGDKFEGKVDILGATQGEYEANAYLTTPIIGSTLSNVVSGRYYRYGGPDAWTGKDGYHYGDQFTIAASDKLVFRPMEGLTIKWYNSYVHDRDHIPQTTYAPICVQSPTCPDGRNLRVVRPDGTVSYYFAGPVNIDHGSSAAAANYNTLVNGVIRDPGVNRKQVRSVLSFNADISGQQLSGFAAYGRERLLNNFDGLYLGANTVVVPNAIDVPTSYSYNQSNLYYNILTKDKQGELRLSAPASWPFRYTIGVNYTKIYGHTDLGYFPTTATGAAAPGGSQLARTINTVQLNPNETVGVFGGIYYDITKQITLSAEIRRQDDHITAQSSPTAPVYSAHFKSWLPRVILNYKPTSNINVYASYSVGNNPGGFNTAVPAAFLPPQVPVAYGEEKLYNYEAGIKTSWMGGRLVFNLAAYHMDWKNEQVQQSYLTNYPNVGAVSSLYTTGARSKVNGFEAELDARITTEFSLRGTASYGKAKYVNYCSSNFFALTGVSTALGCRSVAGNQQEGTPALQLSLYADYSRQLTQTISGYLRADYQYQSKIYLDEFNYAWMSPANLMGLRAGLEAEGWTMEVFVRNLLNDDHSSRSTRSTYAAVGGPYPAVTSIYGTTSAGAAGYQDWADTARRPRQVGIRVGYKF